MKVLSFLEWKQIIYGSDELETDFLSQVVLVFILKNKGPIGIQNKPIQDGGEAKAPLWLNRLSGTDWLTD